VHVKAFEVFIKRKRVAKCNPKLAEKNEKRKRSKRNVG